MRLCAFPFSYSGAMYREKVLRSVGKCDNILGVYTNVHDRQTRHRNTGGTGGGSTQICGRTEPAVRDMKEKTKYFVVREKAVPEVLLKVVEAKRMLDTKRAGTVQEAADQVGISRSSFYKYKDDIFPFRDNIKGKTLTFVLQMHDEPGLLSDVLKVVAEYGANIQTLHQSIPINGVATLTISVEVLATTGDISNMIETIEAKEGIQYLKILARE